MMFCKITTDLYTVAAGSGPVKEKYLACFTLLPRFHADISLMIMNSEHTPEIFESLLDFFQAQTVDAYSKLEV